MDVKVFKTLLEVAKERHFGRAAENLFITQAAVSARVKQLEGYFDTQLFERTKNNIRLTSSGERLIPYAEAMVSTLQQAKLELTLEQHKQMQLIIGGTPNTWDAYLQSALSKMTISLAGYGFTAESQSREQLNRSLLDRTLDMAFSLDPLKADEFHCEVIDLIDLVLVSTHPGDLHAQSDLRYVYVDWGTQFARKHSELIPNSIIPYLRTSTGKIALDFMLERGGYAFLPKALVEPFIESEQLFKVAGCDQLQKPLYMSYRKNNPGINSIKEVVKLVSSLEQEASALIVQAAN
ncbi:LysR family transcriptional regulator [Vibrio maerlii]|uniref:LysR family transcriptional regulator n=1 Tax=Vibrio maerlii TaxID=2231648 RepID=UPI000E3C53BA|nr:LysR family transcriptional regulator [Vibrio maerlii]